jgi:hypothetical protein
MWPPKLPKATSKLGPDIPALIGLLIDLSPAYITTVSAGFVPSAAQLEM